MKLFIVFAVFLTLHYSFVDTCGYETCHKTYPNKLNVHIIAHSHDDVGWKKTLDQYYYGTNTDSQNAGVKYIIESVVRALNSNPSRRFSQVETAFFWKWWQEQNANMKRRVKRLVSNGQLEMVGGAWSMNDEATTNYQSLIDQFTLGLSTIDDLFGECGRPKIGWQIDSFGHSKEMPSLFSQMGYEGVFFPRFDYRDKKKRNDTQNTEFIWRGNTDLGTSSDIFTSIMHRFYNSPDGFCWDSMCSDDPIIFQSPTNENNFRRKVEEFSEYIESQRKVYKTNNILITMGGDFSFQTANFQFKNIDSLIQGCDTFKSNEYNVIYSTPSCYIKAVNEYSIENNVDYGVYTGDFMPYASEQHSYWTGYYTSRPNFKRFERQSNNLLQVAKQLVSFGRASGTDYKSDLTELKEILGVIQHHNAITGTAKQHVTNDYVRIMSGAVTAAESHIPDVISHLIKRNKTEDVPQVQYETCFKANMTRCKNTNSERFAVAVYNPLSRTISHYVRVPVTSINYRVTDPDGNFLEYQVVPAIELFRNDPGTPSLYELVFRASDLPPLGLKNYYVEKTDTVVNVPNLILPTTSKYILGTDVTNFRINTTSGLLTSVTLNGTTIPIAQELMYYTSANKSDTGNQPSGAYVFRPAPDHQDPISFGPLSKFEVYNGTLFDEVHQYFTETIKQIIRIYKQEGYIELDWIVGVEYRNNRGVEVISQFKTDLQNNRVFYTDSNGRGLVKRVRDYRETYEYTPEEPTSGNYYPVTSRIVIKDEKRNLELAVLNDRAQGGSSRRDGYVELMVHRRLVEDDANGVQEVLNEVEHDKGIVARGRHYILVGSNKGITSAEQQHDLVQKMHMSPWIFVGKANEPELARENLLKQIRLEFSGLTRDLPKNVQILTLEPWSIGTLLLRLEHVFESNEDPRLSQPVTVDLKNIFTLYKIEDIQEMTLSANQNLEARENLQWKYTEEQVFDNGSAENRNYKNLLIALNPMQIRTFLLYVKLEDKTPVDPPVEDGGDEDDDNGDGEDDGEEDGESTAYTITCSFVLTLLLSLMQMLLY